MEENFRLEFKKKLQSSVLYCYDILIFPSDIWKVFKDYEYIGRHKYATLSDLDLKPGNSYRAVLKFCAENLCFPPVNGNGVTVLISPPSTGNITLQLVNMTNMNQVR